ncbi:MAG: hypothetical protein ACLUEQ_08715 [Cloacibacillus evryensis]
MRSLFWEASLMHRCRPGQPGRKEPGDKQHERYKYRRLQEAHAAHDIELGILRTNHSPRHLPEEPQKKMITGTAISCWTTNCRIAVWLGIVQKKKCTPA